MEIIYSASIKQIGTGNAAKHHSEDMIWQLNLEAQIWLFCEKEAD